MPVGAMPSYQYGSGANGPIAAMAAASLGPNGGFQSAQLSPPNPVSILLLYIIAIIFENKQDIYCIHIYLYFYTYKKLECL